VKTLAHICNSISNDRFSQILCNADMPFVDDFNILKFLKASAPTWQAGSKHTVVTQKRNKNYFIQIILMSDTTSADLGIKISLQVYRNGIGFNKVMFFITTYNFLQISVVLCIKYNI
jgi:hypothetical protein